MEWVNIIIQGVLIGGLYAMFAAGLALIFGVMRLVNIAHGDLIVLAAYIALMTTDTLGLNPLLAIVVVVPIMAAIGYGLQRGLLNRTLGDDELQQRKHADPDARCQGKARDFDRAGAQPPAVGGEQLKQRVLNDDGEPEGH